ncbi:hypothetical protein [Streptomyces sp. NPDC060002]|uniref:hypothetical protein n=1 Tax=Streptomyces sp. NPDC060002 TaxID=3347033 RepID=UPI0036AAB605
MALADVVQGDSDQGLFENGSRITVDDAFEGGGVWRSHHPGAAETPGDPLAPAGRGWTSTRPAPSEPEEELDPVDLPLADDASLGTGFSEMVGLGILAPNHDGLGWHLRGPKALRMIGTSHEVEARLLRAEHDCELQESIVQEGRLELPDGRPAPLTNTQLDDLLGERSNRTRVVFGTSATGVKDVAHTLRTIAGPIDGWTLPPVGRPSVYKQELVGGRPRERRVVISDFVNYRDSVRPEACRDAVDQAEALLPATPGVTRAVVLVTDPTQLALWHALLTGTEPTSAAPVVLRRHDRRSLRGWAQRVNMFHTEDRLDRLQDLTGGWPLLVDRAHSLHGELGDPDEVLRRLAGLRTDRAEARTFAEATGEYADPLLAAGYRALDDEFNSPFDLEGAVTAVALKIEDEDEDEARWIVNCLDTLQVLDSDNTQLRLEPVLHQCVVPSL